MEISCKIEANFEDLCRCYLVNNGFFEVVNFPFNDNQDEAAISVDNPLDKQRSKMRVCITKSLKENVVFNQNRQKDSIKFFEFSDIYTKDGNENKLAVIVSGRTNKNFKKLNENNSFHAQTFKSHSKSFVFDQNVAKHARIQINTNPDSQISTKTFKIQKKYKKYKCLESLWMP